MQFALGGQIGNFFTSLGLVGAFFGAVLYFLGIRSSEESARKRWYQLGAIYLWAHIVSIWGTFITLFVLIYTHQYQYHYVWAHSSNELPLEYMISCFWEGQEGSFLLWMLWHTVFLAILYKRGGTWGPVVLVVILSVQAILSTMLLGVVISQWIIYAFFLVLVGFLLGLWHKQAGFQKSSWLGYVLGLMVVLGAILQGQIWVKYFLGVIWLGIGIYGLIKSWQVSHTPSQALPLYILWGIGGFVIWGSLMEGEWKVGSSPFILLREVMADAPIFQQNPEFIPTNGNGLNPLLQSYWMVIHPPVLFLGFAASVVPFAYAVAGLLLKDVTGWIRQAFPYMILTGLVLGVGIILGGYWAYETLNFGGYWNWDPVENASLVPWLTAIAAIHAMLIYQTKRQQLTSVLFLTVITFLLVLYSTFLNRSGILGEASVHTFTDLGLSGQLLLLIAVYLMGFAYLWWARKELVQENILKSSEQKFAWWSREGVLLMGILLLGFAALEITFFTSTPVFNKVIGTNFALPSQVPFFYYQWNVWFGIGIALLCGIGQFYFWFKVEEKPLNKALLRPFFISLTSASVIVILLNLYEWEFIYQQKYREILQVSEGKNYITQAFTWVQVFFLMLADDALLLSALFSLACNVDVAVHLLRKHRSHWRQLGGSLSHIGFMLMLIGMLFSSGYEWTVSENLTPAELSNFPANSQKDNVLLSRGKPKYVRGYVIDYYGIRQAQPPLQDVFIVEKNNEFTKIGFTDARGDKYGLQFPAEFFRVTGEKYFKNVQFKEIDLDKIKNFISENLLTVSPKPLNNRRQYEIQLTSLKDTTDKVLLYPEAEVNDRMGLIAHPDRKIEWWKDIYVHVTSVSTDEGLKTEENEHGVRIGDTLLLRGGGFMIAKALYRIDDDPAYKKYDVVVRIELEMVKGEERIILKPSFLVDKQGNVSTEPDMNKKWRVQVGFVGVNPKEEKLFVRVIETLSPDDRITLKALAKPFINVLWLGTMVMAVGMSLALARRWL